MRINEIFGRGPKPNPFAGSMIKTPVYHGTSKKFNQFNRPPHGTFFALDRDWAERAYGDSVIVCYVNVPKLYKLKSSNEFDEQVMEAFYYKDYHLLPGYIQSLKSEGYSAMLAPPTKRSNPEILCVFDNATIVNALTGKAM
jgi:hypothetical protein